MIMHVYNQERGCLECNVNGTDDEVQVAPVAEKELAGLTNVLALEDVEDDAVDESNDTATISI
jgi:hypothetical protein